MSKEVKNSVTPEPSTGLKDLAEAVLFTPNPAHKKLKGKFWSRFMPGPLINIDSMSAVDAIEITKDPRLQKLWSQPGFKDWFLNRDENRERLEYLFTLALDTAEEILSNPDTNPGARVNMVKVVGELANKFPNKWQQEKFTDDEINKMSELQLKSWLERKGVLLDRPKPIQLPIGEVINVDSSEEDSEITQEDSGAREGLRSKLRGEPA